MKSRLIIGMLCWISLISGQEIADSVFWVYFNDKHNNGYQINEPEAFLSQRSIERRGWQGLGVDHHDLPVTAAYVEEIRNMGINVRHVSRWLNGIVMIDLDSARFDEVLAKPFTSLVPWEPETDDVYLPPKPTGSRFDPPLDEPPGFNYGVAAEQVTMLSVDQLHELGYTGMGVWIAVLDAGFNNVDSLPSFEAMIQEGRLRGTRNYVNEQNVYRHRTTHGMYVLSIMGGLWDGNLVGTAPHASYFLCLTENVDQETRIEEIAWIEAAEFVDSLGYDVINTSLGYSDFNGVDYDYTYSDMDGRTTFISRAASLTASRGMIATNSAGNEGNDPWYYITSPADAFDILTVGAVDSDKQIAGFSSRGPSFDARIKPDVVAMGNGTGIQSPSGGLARGPGTSFSAPVIAGSVGSLWQAYPEISARELIHWVRLGGDRSKNPDSTYGFGLPDFTKIYWNITSVSARSAAGRMEVYPNPARDRIMIKLPENRTGNRELRLFDIQGRIIYHSQVALPGEVILPGQIQSGIFVLQVSSDFGIYHTRLIIE